MRRFALPVCNIELGVLQDGPNDELGTGCMVDLACCGAVSAIVRGLAARWTLAFCRLAQVAARREAAGRNLVPWREALIGHPRQAATCIVVPCRNQGV